MARRRPISDPAPKDPKPRKSSAKAHALEARTPDPDNDFSSSPGPPRSACLPRLVFLILLTLGGAMTAIEVRNVLRHPSVLFRSGPKDAPRLIFYQKGRASAREAFLLDEPAGPEGPPRLIQRIDCRPQFNEIGEIRWTADGRAVYAAGRTPQSRGVPVVRWLYEFSVRPPATAAAAPDKSKPASAATLTNSQPPPEGRLYISEPAFALPGRTAFVETPAALTARWKQHQGAGPVAAVWYELGPKGDHLFSWQTTRWEKALEN